MDMIALGRPADTGGIASRTVVDLVSALRTPQFRSRLFGAVRDVFNCAHLSAFMVENGGTPQLLCGIDGEQDCLAQRVGERSLAQWNREPVNALVLGRTGAAAEGDFCFRMTEDEMSRSQYRRQCYDSAHWQRIGSRLVDRMTLARRRDGRYMKLNIYRHEDDGRFSSEDMARFVEWSDLLFTLLHKHFCVERLSADDSTSHYAGALQRHAPLSAREAEVCAEIALGRTSEAIALKLQISINTVLTYRKRAYSRLRISSQNELTRLVHDVAMLDGVAA